MAAASNVRSIDSVDEDESALSGQDSRPGLRRLDIRPKPIQLIDAYFAKEPMLAPKIPRSKTQEGAEQGSEDKLPIKGRYVKWTHSKCKSIYQDCMSMSDDKSFKAWTG